MFAKVRQLKSSFIHSPHFTSTGSYLNDSPSPVAILRSDPVLGRFILGTNGCNEIILWDRQDNNSYDSLLVKPIAKLTQLDNQVTDICWYPVDQSMFAVITGQSGQGQIFATESFEPLITFNLNFRTFCCSFAGTSPVVAFGCKGMIRLCDLRAKSSISTVKMPSTHYSVTSLLWDENDPNNFYCGTSDGTVGIVDWRSLQCIPIFSSTDAVFQLATCDNSLYCIGENGHLHCLDIASNQQKINVIQEPSDFSPPPPPLDTTASISLPIFKHKINPSQKSYSFAASHCGDFFFVEKESASLCMMNVHDTRKNNVFKHATLKCPFYFLEYNWKREEIYLYNNSKIAAIFESQTIYDDSIRKTTKRSFEEVL